ncbi:MAG: C-GCAxxG-C-C family protein [Bacteroidales bacterium]
MKTSRQALKLFTNGYSCSQAILIAFAKDVDLEKDTAFSIGAGLGGGVGRTQNICGAINAGAIILGLRFGNYSSDDSEAKNQLASKVATFVNECKLELGATQCLELTKVDLNNETLKNHASKSGHLARVCNNAVEVVARILEKYIHQ